MEITPVQTEADWQGVIDLIRTVFGPGDQRLFTHFHGREPYCRWSDCKVIKIDGQVAAHVCWVPRQMRIGSAWVRAGMIGYMAVHPEHRGQGLAAALMNAWHAELIARGEHLSMLQGIPYFYEQFGYHFAFPSDLRDTPVVLPVGRIPLSGGPWVLRPYSPADLPALAALFDRENAARTGALERSLDYWEWLLAGLEASGRIPLEGLLLLAAPGGDLNGYAFTRPGLLGQLEVMEAAAVSDPAAAFLLAGLAELARLKGQDRLDLKLPPDHRLARLALSWGAALTGGTFGLFARLLDVQGLFAALAPELARRLQASACAGWTGILRLKTGLGPVDLAIAAGQVIPLLQPWQPPVYELVSASGQVAAIPMPGVLPLHEVEIPQQLLTPLVTGYTTVHYVAGALSVRHRAGLSTAHIPDDLWPLFAALFPKGAPYMWNADIGY